MTRFSCLSSPIIPSDVIIPRASCTPNICRNWGAEKKLPVPPPIASVDGDESRNAELDELDDDEEEDEDEEEEKEEKEEEEEEEE